MAGGGYFVGTPYSEKKYAKIKTRRLISGLLTVNVVHHSDNESTTYNSVGSPTDGFDDANDEFFNHWDGSASGEKLAMQEGNPFSSTRTDPNPSRAREGHSFGDYDCLLYWVVGGMTLHPVMFTSSAQTQAELEALGLVDDATLSTNWNDDVTLAYHNNAYVDSENWYRTITHPCQHFFKTHLIGRMNNAYGNETTDQYLPSGILTNTWELNDNSYVHRKIVDDAGGTGEETDDHLVPPGIATSHATVLDGYSAHREGLWQRHVLSNGVFSSGGTDGDSIYDLSTASNNTYFAPVESVEVYGKHQFLIPTRSMGGETVYSNGDTNAGGGTNYAHTEDYFDMVVKINYASYDSDSSATNYVSVADKEFFKTRTNVFFQPFGETASFSFSDSVHTS